MAQRRSTPSTNPRQTPTNTKAGVKARAADAPKAPATNKRARGKTATGGLATQVKTMATAAVRRAEELIRLIQRRKSTITESFYQIGEALEELLKKKLYAALGYASFEDMLRERDIFGVTQAWQLIKVVGSVPLEAALELGPEKAFAMARYVEATTALDTVQTLLADDAAIGEASAKKASLRDIQEATKEARVKAREAKGTKVNPEAKSAEGAARRARAWLKALGVHDGQATVQRTKDGYRIHVQFNVPLTRAAAFFTKR